MWVGSFTSHSNIFAEYLTLMFIWRICVDADADLCSQSSKDAMTASSLLHFEIYLKSWQKLLCLFCIHCTLPALSALFLNKYAAKCEEWFFCCPPNVLNMSIDIFYEGILISAGLTFSLAKCFDVKGFQILSMKRKSINLKQGKLAWYSHNLPWKLFRRSKLMKPVSLQSNAEVKKPTL